MKIRFTGTHSKKTANWTPSFCLGAVGLRVIITGGWMFLYLSGVLNAMAHAQPAEPEVFDNIIIRHISFEGTSAHPDRLRGIMRTKIGLPLSEYELFVRDKERLANYFRRQGYINATIHIELAGETIHIRINQGRKYQLHQVTIAGNTVLSDRTIRQQLRLKNGDPFDPFQLREAIHKIDSLYSQQGYIYASIHDSLEFPDSSHIDLTLQIHEGIQVRVGQIHVFGNQRVTERIIRRELYLKPGDIFDMEKLQQSQKAIYATGLFTNAFLEPYGIEQQRPVVDLNVYVREDKPRWIGTGAGYGSKDGLRFLVEWGSKNLWNNRHGLKFQTYLTYNFDRTSTQETRIERSQRYQFTYSIPWLLAQRLSLETESFHEREKHPTYRTERSGITVRLSRRFEPEAELAARYRLEIDNIFDLTAQASPEIRQEAGQITKSTLRLFVAQDSRDAVFRPKHGYYWSISDEIATRFLGGTIDFNKTTAQYSHFKTGRFPLVLGMNVEGGYVFPMASTELVPADDRFLLGGTNSLRGYGEQSIGAESMDAQGNPITVPGRIYSALHLELRSTIWRFIAAAIFLDGGNVWRYWNQVNLLNLKYGAGLGIRYHLPVGPIRLEYAIPLKSTKTHLSEGVWHLGLGQIF
ncbi:MAG: hypothetical protein D6675_04450 [Gemmatimonadetes bacterium]|nr:MAG: hypothetical protein D6675_04450 [Gemmatimonadota bacterium]